MRPLILVCTLLLACNGGKDDSKPPDSDTDADTDTDTDTDTDSDTDTDTDADTDTDTDTTATGLLGWCGDGSIDSNEQCDDGNTDDADGCSASCDVEFAWGCDNSSPPSVCVGPISLGVHSPPSSANYVETSTLVAGDSEWFSIEFGADLLLSGSLLNSSGDGDIYLYDLGGIELASWAAYGDESWPGVFLPAGDYLIEVNAYGGSSDITGFTLDLGMTEVVCGDGAAQGAEACDDGNIVAGDGCSPSCTLEGAAESCTSPLLIATPFAAAGADFFADYAADVDLTHLSCSSPSTTITNDAVFELVLAAGETLNVQEHGDLDAVISILSTSCADDAVCLDSLDSGETVGASYTSVSGESVWVVVESYWTSSTSSSYDIRFDTAVCGDGVVASFEACDDGDLLDNGCNTSCQISQGWSCTGAPSVCTGPPNLGSFGVGDIISQSQPSSLASGASDFFDFTLDQDAQVDIALSAVVPGQDPDIYIYDPTGRMVAASASFGDEAFMTSLLAGTYSVEINAFGAVDGYDLKMVFTPIVCGDGLVGATERCEDGNAIDGDGCDASCLIEASTDSCASPPAVASSNAVFAGADFGADYRDSLELSDTSCVASTDSGTADAVFEVSLAAGQTLTLSELGSLDTVVSILAGSCSGASSCHQSFDYPEEVVYTAASAETVWAIVEADFTDAGLDYEIHLDVTP